MVMVNPRTIKPKIGTRSAAVNNIYNFRGIYIHKQID
jgi:hypothetical protein